VGLYSNGRLLTLPVNIILGQKRMKVESIEAYYAVATITTVKSFIVKDPGPNLKRLNLHTLF
jgi:hypothetical protein